MTGSIAPHERNEVRLVLGQLKQLATIEKKKDPIGYAMAISMSGTGALVAHAQPTKDCPEGEVVFTLPKNKNLIRWYLHLLRHGVAAYGIKEYHRHMGRLFGYTHEDIEAFIEADIHCDCSKCRGE